MKTQFISLALVATLCVSCNTENDGDNSGKGFLRISFSKEYAQLTRAGASTLPDSNEFLLRVYNSSGTAIYDGKFGSAPESIMADPGTYTISVVSSDFNEPLFDAPQYGDDRTAKVSAGQTTTVTMECTQLNAGIRLKIAADFLDSYPNGVLYLKSSQGRLMYGYSEKRIAYFKPGSVSLVLNDSGSEQALLTRNIAAREVLTLNISTGAKGSTKGGIEIQIDTSRNWTSEDFIIGEDKAGDDLSTAISVSEAVSHIGESDVWVYGYIVGGDLSSTRCSFTAPFSSRTNLVIATKSSCREKSSCLSVKLSQGDIRDALNLVDNPENLGKQVCLKGDIVSSYYGITGVQGISEYKWK